MSCISFLVRINYKDTAYCKLDNLKFVFRRRNEMKKILAVAVCLSLIIGMVPFVAEYSAVVRPQIWTSGTACP